MKNTLQHKCSGSLTDTKNRIGLSGFNKHYTRKDELEDALEKAEYIYIITDLLKNSYKKVKPAPRGIEGSLLDSCIAGDNQKLVIDLVCLIQSSVANKNPVQILVL